MGETARKDRLKRRPIPTADPTRPRLLANNATGARLLLDIELLLALMRDPAPLSDRRGASPVQLSWPEASAAPSLITTLSRRSSRRALQLVKEIAEDRVTLDIPNLPH